MEVCAFLLLKIYIQDHSCGTSWSCYLSLCGQGVIMLKRDQVVVLPALGGQEALLLPHVGTGT